MAYFSKFNKKRLDLQLPQTLLILKIVKETFQSQIVT